KIERQPAIALDLEQTYWRTLMTSARLFHGAEDLLIELRAAGLPLALVTDLTAQIQFRKLVYFGIDRYFDTIVELGYVGYVLLLGFVIATLHAIGRIADRAPVRAWLVLSLAVHIIITNGLESIWMRGFEMLWVVFLIVAMEAARYWKAPATARQGSPAGTPPQGKRKPVAASVRLHPTHAARLARAAFATPPAEPTFPDGTTPTAKS
ncbi:MAG: hypothetical protein DI543_23960, partial [Bradyrhizobium icense]